MAAVISDRRRERGQQFVGGAQSTAETATAQSEDQSELEQSQLEWERTFCIQSCQCRRVRPREVDILSQQELDLGYCNWPVIGLAEVGGYPTQPNQL